MPVPMTVPASTVAGPGTASLRLAQQWVWSAGQASVGMPASDGPDIAFTVSRQRVVVLDRQGGVRWQVRRDVRDVAPAFVDDLLLVPTEQGLVALDRATGREQWTATVGDRTNTPVITGRRAVATTWGGVMAAVDVADGRVAWQLQLGGHALGPAAASGSTAVATFDAGRVAGATAVDVATGRPGWTVPLPPDGVSGPAIEGGVMVVVAADLAAHGLALDSGAEKWRTPLEGAGSPEVVPRPQGDGTVLVAHRLGGLALLDAREGRARWNTPRAGAAVRGAPAGPGPNGWFALPLHDGRVVLGGLGREPETRAPPSLASGVARGPDGMLLVATEQGKENGVTALRGW